MKDKKVRKMRKTEVEKNVRKKGECEKADASLSDQSSYSSCPT
jgi:hypothetical protein